MKKPLRRNKSLQDCGRTALAVTVLAGTTVPASALDAADVLSYSTGPVVFRPRLTSGVQYNDNLFYATGFRQVSDFLFVVRPGLDFWLGKPTGDNFFKLSYDMDNLFYSEYSGQNSSDHDFGLTSTLKSSRFTLENSDRILYQDSIYGGYNSFNLGASGFSAAIERLSFNLTHKLDYKISERTGTYLQGNYYDMNFTEGVTLRDINTFRFTLGGLYKAFSKTSLFSEIFYGQGASNPNINGMTKLPHTENLGGFLGARGKFTEKLSGLLKAGYENNEFADGSKGISGPIVDASLSAQFTERTSLSLSYTRRSSLSVDYGSLYSSDYVSLGGRQIFGQNGRWIFNLGASYGLNDYPDYYGPDQNLSQDYLGANVGLMYQFRLWLKAGLDYRFQQALYSDKRAIDYTVNTVTITVSVGY